MKLLAHALYWIGDQFERGVPDDLDLNPFEMLCYHASQRIYRAAWRLIEVAPK